MLSNPLIVNFRLRNPKVRSIVLPSRMWLARSRSGVFSTRPELYEQADGTRLLARAGGQSAASDLKRVG